MVEQTVDGVATHYTLDPLGLTDVLEARQGVTVTTYYHGLGPVAEESPSGQRLYYGRDALGSVRFLVNGHRQVVGQYTYSPFGEPYQENGRSPLYRFAGEPWSADAGLTYLRARHYDPALGRFLTRDSFPGFTQMPQSLHPYAYVGNNPVNLTDPSGHVIPVPLIILGVAAAGGLLGGVGAYALYPTVYHEPPTGCFGAYGDIRDVMLWGAAGTGLGVIAGAGIDGGWILGAQFGWWGAASSAAMAQQLANGRVPPPSSLPVYATVNPSNPSSPWLNPDKLARGLDIQSRLPNGLGYNLSSNFKGIDGYNAATETAYSLKTLDTALSYYQNIGNLGSKLTGYVNSFAQLQIAGRGTGQQILLGPNRVFDLAVPEPATPAQWQTIQNFVQNSAIPVRIIVVR